MNLMSEDLQNMAEGTVLTLELKDNHLNQTGILKVTGKLMAIKRHMGQADGSEDTVTLVSQEDPVRPEKKDTDSHNKTIIDEQKIKLLDEEYIQAVTAWEAAIAAGQTVPVTREIPTVLIDRYEIVE